MVMPLGDRFGKLKAIAEKYGFSVATSPVRGTARVHDCLENVLVRALLWTFNPGPARRRRLRLARADLWIDRNTLIDQYLGCREKKGDCRDTAVQEMCLS
jgi:hypothetical protein